MQGYANVTIVGNLGRDPEMRYSKNGNAFTKFSVAVNSRVADQSETVNWYNITCFGKLAEITNNYLKRGNPVLVNGSLQLEYFTKRNGEPGHSLAVVAQNVHFLGDDTGNKAENGDTRTDTNTRTNTNTRTGTGTGEVYDGSGNVIEDDDEIPF
jgi:single-strand DNA-binding protein